ncbi:Fur family zinc uptake transcriptional regulator [Psychrobacter sp. PL15]|uniref:transcriptional repressor n=1 Tax=unclassified Psychrobacter TaxID=196806 RepID=UPI001AE794B4|nr:Fur family zinc uptake transcriptional regulator [Psychrobacter sp. PL15]
MSITSSGCESSTNGDVCDNHVHDNHLHDVQDFTPRDVVERLAAAKEQCRTRGVRFTPLRQQIYELVLQANKPVGAYDLITQLQRVRLLDTDNNVHETKNTTSKNVAPPTVYRSLEFLLSEGLIHQLTSINAYVPCCHPRAQHTAAFLICDQCQRVQECSSLPVQEMMSFAEQDVGFTVARSVIELSGICQACH